MTEFECNVLSDSTVMLMYLERDRVFMSPPYQRESEIWNLYKKQLLIDSLINGYDIPKLYLHEYAKAKKQAQKLFKYAIVDGKQRLSAIWEFMDGGFALGPDITYLRDPKLKLAGLSYEDLRREHPTVHARFTGRTLSVITIRTEDTDLIEDMFSRLNEAVPLNAAEKRNAFGGPVPLAIRTLVKDRFFSSKISVSNTRYRHHDLAVKFLYLENAGRPAETKKLSLDNFVRDFAKRKLTKKTADLTASVEAVLGRLSALFKDKDPLLKSPGTAVVYYLLFRSLSGKPPHRADLARFEKALEDNRIKAEQDLAAADYEMLEYDRLSQTPNDASAIEFRLKVLQKFLGISV